MLTRIENNAVNFLMINNEYADEIIAANTPLNEFEDYLAYRPLENLLHEDSTPVADNETIDVGNVPNLDNWYIDTEDKYTLSEP